MLVFSGLYCVVLHSYIVSGAFQHSLQHLIIFKFLFRKLRRLFTNITLGRWEINAIDILQLKECPNDKLVFLSK